MTGRRKLHVLQRPTLVRFLHLLLPSPLSSQTSLQMLKDYIWCDNGLTLSNVSTLSDGSRGDYFRVKTMQGYHILEKHITFGAA
jgi:hypothetical protein